MPVPAPEARWYEKVLTMSTRAGSMIAATDDEPPVLGTAPGSGVVGLGEREGAVGVPVSGLVA
jgi:hypothetical protein